MLFRFCTPLQPASPHMLFRICTRAAELLHTRCSAFAISYTRTVQFLHCRFSSFGRTGTVQVSHKCTPSVQRRLKEKRPGSAGSKAALPWWCPPIICAAAHVT
eukprot:1567576-Rhodomonas_salina.2